MTGDQFHFLMNQYQVLVINPELMQVLRLAGAESDCDRSSGLADGSLLGIAILKAGPLDVADHSVMTL
jgi:hypothetical protein